MLSITGIELDYDAKQITLDAAVAIAEEGTAAGAALHQPVPHRRSAEVAHGVADVEAAASR